MSDHHPALRPFVEALCVDAGDRLWLGDTRVRRAAAQHDARAQTEADLALCAYEHAYARRFPAVADRRDDAASPSIASALAAANAAVDRTERGWRVVQARTDGAVVVERHGRRLRLSPGHYLALDGVAPPRPGAEVVASFPAGSSSLQFGYHHCFSAAPRDVDDPSPLVRFYFNVRLDGASTFVGALTGSLNRYGIPFSFKITSRAADFDRRDNAVLYVSKDLFRVTALAIASVLPDMARSLDSDVPLFTKALSEGVGVAEDPGVPDDSFGSARCRMIAAALMAARDGSGFRYSAFASALRGAAAAGRLRVDALWLNPGSADDYALPKLVTLRGNAT